MKKLKYILLSFFTFLIIVVIYVKYTHPTIMIMGEEVYMGNPWRKVSQNENLIMEKFIMSNKLYKSQKLFLKEIDSETYIFACFNDYEGWKYYYGIPKINEFSGLSDELEAEIEPPK